MPSYLKDKLSLLQIQTERSLYLHVNLSVAKQNKKNRIMQKKSEISCLHLLGPFDLAYRKGFVITNISGDEWGRYGNDQSSFYISLFI